MWRAPGGEAARVDGGKSPGEHDAADIPDPIPIADDGPTAAGRRQTARSKPVMVNEIYIETNCARGHTALDVPAGAEVDLRIVPLSPTA